MGLEEWLSSIGLGDRIGLFMAERVTMADLPHLTEADLRELGLALGERRRLRRAVMERWPGSESPAPEPRDRLRRLMQGERRPLTAMFVDIVNFTALGEQIGDEELLDAVRAFRALSEAAIARTGGRIIKYLGDGILASFCYPVAHENDPERAVRAGLEIAATVGNIRPLPHWPLSARIGIATGSVIVGELFEDGETALAATGSVLNLAARLQGVAPAGAVVVGEVTHQRIAPYFETAGMGGRELKGFHAPVRCWRVVGPAGPRVQTHGPVLRLHGRADEMAALERAWREVAAGASRAVLLRGEAGVGKSALVEEFLQARRAGGVATATIAGSDLDRDTPFFPIKQFLRNPDSGNGANARAGDQAGDAVARALLAKLGGLPYDATRLDELSAPQQRDRMLEAAACLLLARAEGPLCLLVEDAHWLDPSSAELLGRLVERAAGAPTLLVVTARREFEPPWPARCAGAGDPPGTARRGGGARDGARPARRGRGAGGAARAHRRAHRRRAALHRGGEPPAPPALRGARRGPRRVPRGGGRGHPLLAARGADGAARPCRGRQGAGPGRLGDRLPDRPRAARLGRGIALRRSRGAAAHPGEPQRAAAGGPPGRRGRRGLRLPPRPGARHRL